MSKLYLTIPYTKAKYIIFMIHIWILQIKCLITIFIAKLACQYFQALYFLAKSIAQKK